MPPSRDEWHLDKKVPIALIIGFITQTIVLTAWGASTFEHLDGRVMILEKTEEDQKDHENRITILEQKFDYIRGDLSEIKTLLSRHLPADQPQQ